MTSKEKAKELFLKFRQIPPFSPYTGIDDGEAKQCALIAVDEILNARETVNVHINQHCESNLFDFSQYWQEVKQEIYNYEPNI